MPPRKRDTAEIQTELGEGFIVFQVLAVKRLRLWMLENWPRLMANYSCSEYHTGPLTQFCLELPPLNCFLLAPVLKLNL